MAFTRLATFNSQNMRLPNEGEHTWLDGAIDDDAAENARANSDALAIADHNLTASLTHWACADLVALQKVFDQATLDHFHDAFLAPLGATYPHCICIEDTVRDPGSSIWIALGDFNAHDH